MLGKILEALEQAEPSAAWEGMHGCTTELTKVGQVE